MPLDIGVGLLLGLVMERAFYLNAGLVLPIAGVCFSLAPDLDFLVHVIRYRTSRNVDHHREALHVPLLYIPIGTLLLLPLGITWSCLFAAASLAHFIHDSIGIGWGVPWLYPFTDDSYSFLYHLENTVDKPKIPHRWLYVWPRRKIDQLASRYGDPDWMKNIYLVPHPYAIIEYVALAIGVATVALSLKS
jgi:hypothetical protein